MKKIFFIFLLSLLLLPVVVRAEVVCECTDSSGQKYEIERGSSLSGISGAGRPMFLKIVNESTCESATRLYVSAGNPLYSSCVWTGESTVISEEVKKSATSPLISDIKGIDTLNQLNDPDIKRLLGKIIAAAMGLMGSVALLMFVYGGVTWMMGSTSVAGGASKKDVLKAKSIIQWSVYGLIVIMASYVIVDFLFNIF